MGYNRSANHNINPARKKIQVYKVTKETELLPFLMEAIHGLSRNAAKSYCTLKYVYVDERLETKANRLLKPGQQVSIDKTIRKNLFKHPLLDIVYEDNDLIVVNKKEGLLSVAATQSDKEITAHRILQDFLKRKDKRNRVFVVHRLDRETSGLMLFAKSMEIQHTLRDHWKDFVFERKYVAVVNGILKQSHDTIHTWLKEDRNFLYTSSDKPGDGIEAITHYRTLTRNPRRNMTMIDLQLETGRKNQIRVHMQSVGHPVVGDYKYGMADGDPLKRLALHAYMLAFNHPVTGKQMRFETAFPKAFTVLMKTNEKPERGR